MLLIRLPQIKKLHLNFSLPKLTFSILIVSSFIVRSISIIVFTYQNLHVPENYVKFRC